MLPTSERFQYKTVEIKIIMTNIELIFHTNKCFKKKNNIHSKNFRKKRNNNDSIYHNPQNAILQCQHNNDHQYFSRDNHEPANHHHYLLHNFRCVPLQPNIYDLPTLTNHSKVNTLNYQINITPLITNHIKPASTYNSLTIIYFKPTSTKKRGYDKTEVYIIAFQT